MDSSMDSVELCDVVLHPKVAPLLSAILGYCDTG